MRFPDELIGSAAVLIEFGGSVVIAFSCVRGLGCMALGWGTRAAIGRGRLVVADGIVSALGLKTAATLLRTIELRTWTAIGLFAATLALRTFVKRVLVWEEARLERAPRSEVPRSMPDAGIPSQTTRGIGQKS